MGGRFVENARDERRRWRVIPIAPFSAGRKASCKTIHNHALHIAYITWAAWEEPPNSHEQRILQDGDWVDTKSILQCFTKETVRLYLMHVHAHTRGKAIKHKRRKTQDDIDRRISKSVIYSNQRTCPVSFPHRAPWSNIIVICIHTR